MSEQQTISRTEDWPWDVLACVLFGALIALMVVVLAVGTL